MTAKTKLPNPVEDRTYWVDDFKVTDQDVEYLFNLFLEQEEPLSLRDITYDLIENRIRQETNRVKKQVKNGTIFQPRNNYEVGQLIVFPALGFQTGEVVSTRKGSNEEYGDFDVLEVELEDGLHEFAFNLTTEHPLNLDTDNLFEESIDAEQILRIYGRAIARKVKTRFDEEEDVVYLAGRWYLKSLLADINISHLHLAEAILDMHGGGPLTTDEIFQEIGMEEDVNKRLQIFSLDYAMQRDGRFDEVGPAGKVLWFLERMEPDEVRNVPIQLQYETLDFNFNLLSDEMKAHLLNIDDELSPIEAVEEEEEEVTISLIYPYRRTGTLPISARLEALFPTAYETTRIRMTMIDQVSGEEIPTWVVREAGYVYGLWDYYTQHQMPIGAYITIRKHEDDPAKVYIDFSRRPRPRTEWIKLAVPADNRVTFENHKRAVGADYDELLNFGVEDVKGLDALWNPYRRLPLSEVMRRLLPELASLTPQEAVHLTTLYSAVNLVRRCPPDPIFTTLVSNPDFENVGGPYWRLASY